MGSGTLGRRADERTLTSDLCMVVAGSPSLTDGGDPAHRSRAYFGTFFDASTTNARIAIAAAEPAIRKSRAFTLLRLLRTGNA